MSVKQYRTYRSFLDNVTDKRRVNNIYYELEYVYLLNKIAYDKIKNGEFESYNYSYAENERQIFELSKTTVQNSKLVSRVTLDTNTNNTTIEHYLKTRISRERMVQSGFACNLSSERKVLFDSSGNNVFEYTNYDHSSEKQKSIRHRITTPSGHELELIDSVFGETESYRIEFECKENMSETEWEYAGKEIVALVALAQDIQVEQLKKPGLSHFVKYYADLFGSKYKNATSLRAFLSNPITYNRSANLRFQAEDFYGTPKLDGRIAVFGTLKQGWAILGLDFGMKRVEIDKEDYVEKIKSDAKDCLVFGEYLEETNTFWAFDVLLYEDEIVMNEPNKKRINVLPEVVKYIKSLELDVDVTFEDKPFYDLEDPDNYDKAINDTSGGANEGLVLYKKDEIYNGNNSNILKLKYQELNTADLLLHKRGEKLFFCIIKIGNKTTLNWDQSPELKGVGESLYGEQIQLFQLYIPGYGDIGISDIGSCDYETKEVKQAILESMNCNFIVEVLRQPKKGNWLIKRIRYEKNMPNAHHVVLDNVDLSITPIEKDEFYSSSQTFYKYEDDESYKLFNAYASHCTRYQIEYWYGQLKDRPSYFSSMPVFNVFEDVASGRGGRINDINKLAIKQLVFTDISHQSLFELTQRISSFSRSQGRGIDFSGVVKKMGPRINMTSKSVSNKARGMVDDSIVAHNQYGRPIYSSDIKAGKDISNTNKWRNKYVSRARKIEVDDSDNTKKVEVDDADNKIEIDDSIKASDKPLEDTDIKSLLLNEDPGKYLNPIINVKDIRIQQLDLTSMAAVMKELEQRTQKVSAFIMIYAIHYMFRDERSFEAFAKYINDLSESGTMFFTNIIDVGVALKMNLTRYRVVPFGEYDLSLPFNNQFNFSIPFKSKIAGQLVYNKEPGITEKTLVESMKKIGWRLLGKTKMYKYINTEDDVRIPIKLEDKDDKIWRTAHKTFCFQKI